MTCKTLKCSSSSSPLLLPSLAFDSCTYLELPIDQISHPAVASLVLYYVPPGIVVSTLSIDIGLPHNLPPSEISNKAFI